MQFSSSFSGLTNLEVIPKILLRVHISILKSAEAKITLWQNDVLGALTVTIYMQLRLITVKTNISFPEK